MERPKQHVGKSNAQILKQKFGAKANYVGEPQQQYEEQLNDNQIEDEVNEVDGDNANADQLPFDQLVIDQRQQHLEDKIVSN